MVERTPDSSHALDMSVVQPFDRIVSGYEDFLSEKLQKLSFVSALGTAVNGSGSGQQSSPVNRRLGVCECVRNGPFARLMLVRYCSGCGARMINDSRQFRLVHGFVISRSSVQVRSPAPVFSMTDSDLANRLIWAC